MSCNCSPNTCTCQQNQNTYNNYNANINSKCLNNTNYQGFQLGNNQQYFFQPKQVLKAEVLHELNFQLNTIIDNLIIQLPQDTEMKKEELLNQVVRAFNLKAFL